MNHFLLLIFAFLPSVIWLLFYLKKDAHPESNWMILKIFFYGMLAALPAALIELGASNQLESFALAPVLTSLLFYFGIVAFTEEGLKYLVVRDKVFSNPEFDEPVDLMLYMIIAGLGFAASENILIFLSPEVLSLSIEKTLILTGFRFIGATFLHALCSGILGYFLALSFFETKHQIKLFITGLGLVILLHGLYDFSIMVVEGSMEFALPIIILISLAMYVFFGFKKLKKLKSVCKII